MNAVDQVERLSRPRVQLEPPLIELTSMEAEEFDALVFRRIQERGGLASDARQELVREVIAAGVVVVAGATGLEANRALVHELAEKFRSDRRFTYEEREQLVHIARAFGAAIALVQSKNRDIEALALMARGETGI